MCAFCYCLNFVFHFTSFTRRSIAKFNSISVFRFVRSSSFCRSLFACSSSLRFCQHSIHKLFKCIVTSDGTQIHLTNVKFCCFSSLVLFFPRTLCKTIYKTRQRKKLNFSKCIFSYNFNGIRWNNWRNEWNIIEWIEKKWWTNSNSCKSLDENDLRIDIEVWVSERN